VRCGSTAGGAPPFLPSYIGRITTEGVITLSGAIGSCSGNNPLTGPITAGPDGAMWFTESAGFTCVQIGRITTAGVITQFPIPTAASSPTGITAGSDGALWFTEISPLFGSKIGRITTAGTLTEFPIPTSKSQPLGITAGPDGALWFTEFNGNKIGRLLACRPPSTHDFNGDCTSDILWRDTSGNTAAWLMNGKVPGTILQVSCTGFVRSIVTPAELPTFGSLTLAVIRGTPCSRRSLDQMICRFHRYIS
jgi:hypothetical protein